MPSKEKTRLKKVRKEKQRLGEKNKKSQKSSVTLEREFNLVKHGTEKVFRRMIESVKAGIYIADIEGRLFYCNGAFANLLGYVSKEEILGINLLKDVFIDRRTKVGLFRELQSKGFVQDYEIAIKRRDGHSIYLSATCNFIRSETGHTIGIEGVVNDITDKKHLSEALLNEKHKLEEILAFDETIDKIKDLNEMSDYIVRKTAEILHAQKSSLMLFNKEDQSLYIHRAVGIEDDVLRATKVKLGEEISGYVAANQEAVLVHNIEYDKRFKRGNRPRYLGRSFVSVPVKFEDKLIGVLNVADKMEGFPKKNIFNDVDLKVMCVIAREVGVAIENVKLYKELNLMTVTDPLTHIYNYRQFSHSLDHEIRRYNRDKGNLCIMMMDVDEFKSYNDTFGHLEGDNLLKQLGIILKKELRDSDIVCRYAGDEFVMVLPDCDIHGAESAAVKVKNAVEAFPFKRKVTISLGAAQYQEGLTPKEFIARADEALYDAKHGGRNRVGIFRPNR
ncbi:MAG: diguanylate cyclase [Candidatus Omnitrophica bacterium]|nr:diguanylate cyclase [Candidatus Omnitrophota bacterium]